MFHVLFNCLSVPQARCGGASPHTKTGEQGLKMGNALAPAFLPVPTSLMYRPVATGSNARPKSEGVVALVVGVVVVSSLSSLSLPWWWKDGGGRGGGRGGGGAVVVAVVVLVVVVVAPPLSSLPWSPQVVIWSRTALAARHMVSTDTACAIGGR